MRPGELIEVPGPGNYIFEQVIPESDKVLYIIGSLRNPEIPRIAEAIRLAMPEIEVFDDWYAAGPEADDYWKVYEKGRGRNYAEALAGHAARHVFEFDKFHLDRASHVLLVLPAGKSGHMEATYAKYGAKAKVGVLLEPEFDGRYDVMYQFLDGVFEDLSEVLAWLK